ncbi:PPOX class probable F420-dependent enzyme [Rhodococcus sp. 27YEA15]|uniref:pyridoxamine 5'-phosphate oxidase family protein n=1 Tax=Rhodococcus sp. 27YEA15 TaxID=3156259 RepID=UPI003C7A931C
MGLGDEKTISVTTFHKNGDGVATATWIVPLADGRVGFSTSSTSGKAKRLRNNAHVTVVPCDSRGKVRAGASPVGGTAQLVTSGAALGEVVAKVKAKYGVLVPLSKFFATVQNLSKGKGKAPYADAAVIISVDT